MSNNQRFQRRILCLFILLLTVGLSLPTFAARITIVNLNGAGAGFNDATVVTAVTGNSGTTLGAQRLNAFQAAANYWGSRLVGSIDIKVNAILEPLPCDMSSAVLGSAGPITASQGFPNAPVADTWYPIALANSLAGFDIDGNNSDITASFNSDIDDDDANCLAGITWYYGVGVDPPVGKTSFYDTVLHEIGHGLGFTLFANAQDGTELGGDPDIYESFLEDHSLAKLWPAMTAGERVTSATDTGDLHWVGPAVANVCPSLQSGTQSSNGSHVEIYAPNPLESGSSISHWNTNFSPDELMEPLATATSSDALTRGLLQDIGWPDITMEIRSAGDVNGDGTEDVAVLATDFNKGYNIVFVYSGLGGAQLSKIFFPTGFSARGDGDRP